MCIINYFIINILVLHTHTCVLRYYKYTCVTYTYMYIILLQYNCITGIHTCGLLYSKYTNRIYLFNSAEYLTASKTVACKQVQTTSFI